MDNFQKIINLIKKTGDKAIILDNNGDPSYVIMPFNDYERLMVGRTEVAGLTEDELLDKINRDIAVWKDTQEVQELSIDQYDFSRNLGKFSNFNSFADRFAPDFDGFNELEDNEENKENEEFKPDDQYYFEPVE